MPIKRVTSAAKCPAGVLCLTPGLVFFLLALVAAGLLILATMRGQGSLLQRMPPLSRAPRLLQPQPQPQQPIHISIRTPPQEDGRYAMAPQPYRSWAAEPEFPPRGGLSPIPVNIPTRGLPEKFQSMGVITTPDGQVLPLYGRRTASSGDKWNYYTRTDTYNPVPLPLRVGRRDCTEDIGCNELSDGDEISTVLAGQGGGKVTLYRMDGPKYIPGLI